MSIKKYVNCTIKIVVVGALLYGVSIFCEKETKGFSIAKISSDMSFDPRWETALPSYEEIEQLQTIFQKKFRYLGAGGQCFAFLSDDGNYVIKFFKHHRREKAWYASFPFPTFIKEKIAKKTAKKNSKLERDFSSYKMAYEELKEETGLLFVHLNKTDSLHLNAKIVDPLNIEHEIPLDSKEFIVQKKAELVYPKIKKLMDAGQKEQAARLIGYLLDVIVARSQKGIYDEDARIHRNFGFIGEQAIVLDAGRFRKDPARKKPEVYKEDLHNILKPFKTWLSKEYPELNEALDERMYEIQTSL